MSKVKEVFAKLKEFWGKSTKNKIIVIVVAFLLLAVLTPGSNDKDDGMAHLFLLSLNFVRDLLTKKRFWYN